MSYKSSLKSTQEHDDEIDLLLLLSIVRQGKYLILIFIIISLLTSFIFAFGQPKIYKADTLLRVESKKASVPGLEEIAGLTNEDASVGTEIELIKSRKNIAIAVKSLKLDIIAKPKKIRFFSNLHKHFYSPEETKKLVTKVKQIDAYLYKYAWGNEQIKIDRFDIPNNLLNKVFLIVIKENNTFNLLLKKEIIMEGKVGHLSVSKDGLFKLFASKITGMPGTEFELTRLSMRRAIASLQHKIVAIEKSKKTGVITLSLTGTNEKSIINILNKLTTNYVDQNKSRSSEEASNALSFLKEQIKPVKERVDKAEAAIQSYRIKNQTTNLPLETQNILNLVATIEADYQKLELAKEENKRLYTENHPTVMVINDQQKKLIKRKKKIESKITKLPKKQQILLKLEREIKVADAIYIDLLNKIQEFKIAKASTVGNAYVIDIADIDENHIKPNKKTILTIGLLLGIILGVVVIILRKFLRHAIENPDELEKATELPVYATVPFSRKIKQTGAFGNKKQKALLAKKHNTDPAIESLRSLRTSLHFALHDAKNNIVMITGPSPGIGKSFISSNFSAVVAASKQRVVLIDADMRKGYVHNLFKINMTPGLSDAIANKATFEEIIHTVDVGDGATMDIISRGQKTPNPSELLMHDRFKALLDHLSKNYDLVLIDSPPIHAVTDPSIIGAHVGVVFMVVLAGQHSLREVEHAVERLAHNGVETKGFIFNGHKANSGYGYGYGYGYKSYYGD